MKQRKIRGRYTEKSLFLPMEYEADITLPLHIF